MDEGMLHLINFLAAMHWLGMIDCEVRNGQADHYSSGFKKLRARLEKMAAIRRAS